MSSVHPACIRLFIYLPYFGEYVFVFVHFSIAQDTESVIFHTLTLFLHTYITWKSQNQKCSETLLSKRFGTLLILRFQDFFYCKSKNLKRSSIPPSHSLLYICYLEGKNHIHMLHTKRIWIMINFQTYLKILMSFYSTP